MSDSLENDTFFRCPWPARSGGCRRENRGTEEPLAKGSEASTRATSSGKQSSGERVPVLRILPSVLILGSLILLNSFVLKSIRSSAAHEMIFRDLVIALSMNWYRKEKIDF